MASDLDFVEYVCQQCRGAGLISYKKMFGEYALYCHEKVFGLICDNQFFVKKTKAEQLLNPPCEEAPPYKGAKPHLIIEDLDNTSQLTKFIKATCEELPAPKPKKNRSALQSAKTPQAGKKA